MKGPLHKFQNHIEVFIKDSITLMALWHLFMMDKYDRELILQISPDMPDVENTDAAIWLKGKKLTDDNYLAADLVVMLAHELKHAHNAKIYKNLDDIDNERIAYAFQALVRAELKAKGWTVSRKTLPMDEKELVKTYKGYYGKNHSMNLLNKLGADGWFINYG